MAKPKTEKSPLAIAAEKARDTYNAAKEALAAKETEKNKAAFAAAETALRDAQQAERAERFKRVGGGRVAQALKAVGLLNALTNRNTYSFTQEQADKIMKDLRAKVDGVGNSFATALAPKTTVAGAKAKETYEL